MDWSAETGRWPPPLCKSKRNLNPTSSPSIPRGPTSSWSISSFPPGQRCTKVKPNGSYARAYGRQFPRKAPSNASCRSRPAVKRDRHAVGSDLTHHTSLADGTVTSSNPRSYASPQRSATESTSSSSPSGRSTSSTSRGRSTSGDPRRGNRSTSTA